MTAAPPPLARKHGPHRTNSWFLSMVLTRWQEDVAGLHRRHASALLHSPARPVKAMSPSFLLPVPATSPAPRSAGRWSIDATGNAGAGDGQGGPKLWGGPPVRGSPQRAQNASRIYSENVSCLFKIIESNQDSLSNPASVRWCCSWIFQEMLSQLPRVGSLDTLSRGDSSTPPTMALQRTRPPHLVVPSEVIAHVRNQMNSFHDTPAFLEK
ncbi:hypothetical protein BHM03_00057766 [Ensete ventricosum]|nr:hypothetical protein BHM03_00057766 [Ensete ventricosum]